MTQWQKIVPTREGLCSLVSATPLAEGDEAISYDMRSEPADEDESDDADDEDAENIALEDAREIFGFTGDDIELKGYDEEPFIVFE